MQWTEHQRDLRPLPHQLKAAHPKKRRSSTKAEPLRQPSIPPERRRRTTSKPLLPPKNPKRPSSLRDGRPIILKRPLQQHPPPIPRSMATLLGRLIRKREQLRNKIRQSQTRLHQPLRINPDRKTSKRLPCLRIKAVSKLPVMKRSTMTCAPELLTAQLPGIHDRSPRWTLPFNQTLASCHPQPIPQQPMLLLPRCPGTPRTWLRQLRQLPHPWCRTVPRGRSV